jgi:transcriptional regulator with GAF, ATPase, and Fis domain
MIFKRYKLQSLLLYIGTLLFIILIAVARWNIHIKNNSPLGVWPFLFLILAILSASALYITYLKDTNTKILENIIRQKVEEERTRILSEFNTQEEKNLNSEAIYKINDKVSQILPKGNFKNPDAFAKKLLTNLADELEVTQGIVYTLNPDGNSFGFLTGYALTNKEPVADFKLGENLNGQVAASQEIMVVKDIPDDYLSVESGLGKSKPRNLIIMPIIHDNKTIGILEITTFLDITNNIQELLTELGKQASEKMTQLNVS